MLQVLKNKQKNTMKGGGKNTELKQSLPPQPALRKEICSSTGLIKMSYRFPEEFSLAASAEFPFSLCPSI